jgi:hypothetical protein
VPYALWNYLATPFVFTAGFETREIGPLRIEEFVAKNRAAFV